MAAHFGNRANICFEVIGKMVKVEDVEGYLSILS
jgi:hypothetical protein